MANALKIVPLIAKEALRQLDNELVFGKSVFRGYEEDFAKKPNGYKQGDTLTIRRPADFYVRDGAIMDVQDIVEGSTTIVLDKLKGVDFSITNLDMTLSMSDLSERVIRPAAKQLANQIDVDLAALYFNVNNWATTNPPSSPVNSFADFAKAPERLTEMGVPQDERKAVLSPADYYGLMGSQTGLSFGGDSGIGNKAYRTGDVGMIDDIEVFRTQNVASLTCGTRTTAAVDQALISTTVSYVTYKDAAYYTLHMDGLGTGGTIKKGEVFTIANCYDVNPVTKARLGYLKQFTVMEDVTADSVTTGDADVKIFPWPIGANTHGQQNCDFAVTDLDDDVVTWFGTASNVYRQNLVFNKNAFALVIVPLVEPMAAVNVKTETYKGTSIRIWPGADQNTNVEKWRMDVLYGVKCVDPRLAVRLSGSS